MKGIKFKAGQAGRKAALLGAAIVAAAGLSVLGAGAAHAAVGNQPGKLTFSPATGTNTTVATWSTSNACPNGYGFANLDLVAADYTPANDDINIIGATVVSATAAIVNAQISSSTPLAQVVQAAGYSVGQPAEAVVQCASDPSGGGNQTYYQDEWITLTASGGYTTSSTGPAQAATPTVVVSANPSTVQVGNDVTLTATVTASGGTPTGTVQFYDGAGTVGGLVPVTAGVATLPNITFMATGSHTITAAYNSDTPTSWNSVLNTASTSTTVSVSLGNPLAPTQVITVSVPPSGSFQISTVATPPAGAGALTVSGATGTGIMVPVQVIDTRTGVAAGTYTTADGTSHTLSTEYDGYPGWNVVGQATDFTDPNSHPAGDIPVSNFNWTPAAPVYGASNPTTGGTAAQGSASTTGLGTAQTLASAVAGQGDGSFTLGANLTLAIPATAPAGAYTSTLTLTADPWVNQGF